MKIGWKTIRITGKTLRRVFIGAVWAISFVLLLLDYHRGTLPSVEGAEKNQKELQTEFSEISVPRWATPLEFQYSPRADHALIGRAFESTASFAEIRTFYDAEFSKRHWVAIGEAPVREWGVFDHGGRIRVYCNSRYDAEIFYPGNQKAYGGSYTLTFSWPPRRECLLKESQ